MRAPKKTNSLSKTSPSSGFTISLKKKTDYDKVAAFSFISEIQSSIGKYKTFKFENVEKESPYYGTIGTSDKSQDASFIQSKNNLKIKKSAKELKEEEEERLTTRIIPLKNYRNSQYTGEVMMGTPGQKVPLILDTGSANMWITSTACPDKVCKESVQFDRKKSSTYKNVGLKADISFGSGRIIGELNSDTFGFGDIIVKDQKFGEIEHEIGSVFTKDFSGLMGLAYPSMAAYGQTPVFDNMIKQKLLKKNIMTFFYSLNQNTDGEVSFGFIDETKYHGKLRYYDVVDKWYWSIMVSDILYDGKSLGLCPHGCRHAVDSGTSINTAPSKFINSLLRQIPIDDHCHGYETAGKFTYVIGNDKYDLLPEEYMIKTEFDNIRACRKNFMPLDLGEKHGPGWILGDNFMQKFYTVFDRDNNRVGFAPAKHAEGKITYH